MPAATDPQPWQTIFTVLSEAVCILDLEGRVLNYNQALEVLLGLPAGEILGRKCCLLLYGTEQPIPGCPFARLLETRHRESLTVAANGRTLQVTAEPLLDEAGNLIGAVQLVTDISGQVRERKALLTRIQELEGQQAPRSPLEIPLGRLALKLMRQREEENRRLRRILSDDVGKLLAGLKLELRSLQKKKDDPALSPPLQACLEATERSWGAVKDLIDAIRPPLLDDLGLVPALRAETRRLEKRKGIPVLLQIDEYPAGLSPEMESACFQLVQAALLLQSRQARSLSVSVQTRENRLNLCIGATVPGPQTAVAPDGDAGEENPTWLELRERALLLGGEAHIRYLPGSGPEIRFQIPRPERP